MKKVKVNPSVLSERLSEIKESEKTRWAEASGWNPDDFETHPASPEFSKGKEPPVPREG